MRLFEITSDVLGLEAAFIITQEMYFYFLCHKAAALCTFTSLMSS